MGIKRYNGVNGISYNWRFRYENKTYTGTFDTDSEREARERFLLVKAQIKRGQQPVQKAEKAELLTTFIETEFLPRAKKARPDVMRTDSHIYTAIKKYFVGRRLDDVTREDCRQFQSWRLTVRIQPQKEGGATRQRNPRTVNREFSVLSSVFQLAVTMGRLVANPCHGVASLKFATATPTIWTRDQALKAIVWMRDKREHVLPLVLVALQTGLSRKDLFRLTVEQVQIEGERGVIRKRRAKTGAAIDVPLNTVAIEVLQPLIAGRRKEAFVFINRLTGKPYRDIRKSLDSVCRLAGVPRVTWHKLRHCVGTWLAEDGAGIEVIARFLGHSDYRTAPVYVQLAAEKVRPQAEKLGAWVKTANPESGGKKAAKTTFGKLKLVG